jgi:hypothetical protein
MRESKLLLAFDEHIGFLAFDDASSDKLCEAVYKYHSNPSDH